MGSSPSTNSNQQRRQRPDERRFGSGGSGFSTGGKAQIIEQALENFQVLTALNKLTGQNFDYNQAAWRTWYEANRAKPVIAGRRISSRVSTIAERVLPVFLVNELSVRQNRVVGDFESFANLVEAQQSTCCCRAHQPVHLPYTAAVKISKRSL